MSIFKNATVHSTQMWRMNSLHKPEVTFSAEQTGRMRDTIDQSTEYVLELRLCQNFWANQAQRKHVENAARRALAAHLYEDVLREIPHLILAIESGDREEALEAALRIKQATQP